MGVIVLPTLLDSANLTIMADEVNSTEVVTVVSYGSEATVVTPAAYACNVSQPIPSVPLCSSCQCCCPASLLLGLGVLLDRETAPFPYLAHLESVCTYVKSKYILTQHLDTMPRASFVLSMSYKFVSIAVDCQCSMQCLEPGPNTLQPAL